MLDKDYNEFGDPVSRIKMKRVRLPRKHAMSRPAPESFWSAESITAEVASVAVPFASIESEFEQKRAETRQVKAQKKTADYLLEPNRVKIYSIVLAKCRFSALELAEAFSRMDRLVLDDRNLEILEGLLPTLEDTRTLDQFAAKQLDVREELRIERLFAHDEGPRLLERLRTRLGAAKISRTERFLCELLMIRDVRDMVRFLQLMTHFERVFEMLKNSLNDYMEPFIQFACQKRFLVLIRLLLRIVNFINNGASQKSQYQQKLTSRTIDLEGLRIALDTRGLLRRKHLACFAIESLGEREPSYFHFARNWCFKRHEQYVMSELRGNLLMLESYLAKCEDKLKRLQREGFCGLEKFCDVLFAFIRGGYDKINAVKRLFEKFGQYQSELCRKYGFREQSPDKILKVFNRMLDLVKDDLLRREKERRRAERAQKKGGIEQQNVDPEGSPEAALNESEIVFKMKDRIKMLKKRNMQRKGVQPGQTREAPAERTTTTHFSVNRNGVITFD